MASEVEAQTRYYRHGMELPVDTGHVRLVRRFIGAIARCMPVVDGDHVVATGSTEQSLTGWAAYIVQFYAQHPQFLNKAPHETGRVHLTAEETVILSGVQSGLLEVVLFGNPATAGDIEAENDTPLRVVGSANEGWQLVVRASDEVMA